MTKPYSGLFSEFVRPSISDAVTGYLRDLILRGAFEGRLPGERELAVEFNVGRPSVRQALDNLAAEGLIERGHGKPTRVRVLVRNAVDALPVNSTPGDPAAFSPHPARAA